MARDRPPEHRAGRHRLGRLRPVATHILSGLQVILGVALIVLVLMHSGKDTGLSGMLNPGGSSYGGTAVMERNLTRITVAVALVFTANVIALGFLL